jgi:hypothetical protein
MRRTWKFWYDSIQDRLYQHTKEGLTVHHRLWYDFNTEGQPTTSIPATAIPADVDKQADTWSLRNRYSARTLPESITNNGTETLITQIMRMRVWEKELLQGINIQVPIDILQHELTRTLHMASDGSVQEHRASFGWIIANGKETRLATCQGPAYGSRPTSYRAEG